MTHKYSGTGDPLIEIELPDGHGTFVIEDDGCNDPDVLTGIRDADGNRKYLSNIRRVMGDDEQFIAVLEAAFGDDTASDPGGGSTTSFGGPPVFKCDDCNQSWPRSKNQTPDQSTDTCPQCDTQ